MKMYEYQRIVVPDYEDDGKKLNPEGAKGWRVIKVVDYPGASGYLMERETEVVKPLLNETALIEGEN